MELALNADTTVARKQVREHPVPLSDNPAPVRKRSYRTVGFSRCPRKGAVP